jgi:hypothetical protein
MLSVLHDVVWFLERNEVEKCRLVSKSWGFVAAKGGHDQRRRFKKLFILYHFYRSSPNRFLIGCDNGDLYDANQVTM